MDSPQPTDSSWGGDGHRMPRWVQGFAIAAVVVVLLAVAVLAMGSGGHGPSRHLPGGETETTPAPEGHAPLFHHG